MATYRIEPAGSGKWKAIDQDRKTIKVFWSQEAAEKWLAMAQPTKGDA